MFVGPFMESIESSVYLQIPTRKAFHTLASFYHTLCPLTCTPFPKQQAS